jgi:hypothetical protein
MIWKKFLLALSISGLVAFPQNIIGCAGGDDPYDYYVSFFWNDQTEQKGYSPFYYTLMMRWYDQNETPTVEEVNTKEWAGYFGTGINETDVRNFIYNYAHKDLGTLYSHIEKNKPLTVPDSVKKNTVTGSFIKNKDFETLGYIMYAKQVEPLVSISWDAWEPVKMDTAKLGKMIKNGTQLYNAAKKDYIKLRYGYQLVRLAQYARRYDDCINYYEKYIESNATVSYLKTVSLAHKAGAIYKTGRKDEAAWLFSKAFAESPVKRLSNMLSFYFCYPANADRNMYLKLCKNNREKANMLGMFAMNSIKNESNTLKQIAELDATSPLLEIVTTREINKAEEHYFTPMLSKMYGRSLKYYYWDSSDSMDSENKFAAYREEVKELQKTVQTLAQNKSIKNPGFYYLATAYTAFMLKDYAAAEQNLSAAKNAGLTSRQTDQWNLTKLLLTINKQNKIDAAFEEQVLPQIKWLHVKANGNDKWSNFYRDLLNEIIAPKYEQQSNKTNAALIYGLDYVQNKMNTDEIMNLYNLLSSLKTTGYEKFLITEAGFKKDDVINVIGTSYLRDYNFPKAIEWFKKADNSDTLSTYHYDYNSDKSLLVNVNPFHDYINDRERFAKPLPKPYTKLTLAQKLLDLEKSIDTAKSNTSKAKIYYQLASAFYNMSYYGNSWMAAAYDRSGVNWNEGNYKTNWEKEYFAVIRAKAYYQKAYELSPSKEFKAAAFFLVAKCAQRQIPRPGYGNWTTYNADFKVFQQKFQKNPLFTQFKNEFGTTAFYQRAYTTCSYLKDFVRN